MPINLISDTVTKPTPAMLDAMMRAEVGDDVFQEDPTVNALQEMAAEMFGKEAALFCPSGTMTNQIALAVHTRRLDEVICDKLSHIYQFETGGYAANAGISVKLLDGEHGKVTPKMVSNSINPDYDWLPKSSLVVLENTCNKGGGTYYTLEEVRPIAKVCRDRGLKLHLDGARLFNALCETGETPKDWGASFDSLSICLSKGLGAPVGSLLLGDAETIREARRVRKVMGGGMRQAGYLAAAGIYALEHHVERLRDDHARARALADCIAERPFSENLRPMQTNILIFDVRAPYTAASFLAELAAQGVLASPFGPQTVRMVTHLDFTDEMLAKTLDVLRRL